MPRVFQSEDNVQCEMACGATNTGCGAEWSRTFPATVKVHGEDSVDVPGTSSEGYTRALEYLPT